MLDNQDGYNYINEAGAEVEVELFMFQMNNALVEKALIYLEAEKILLDEAVIAPSYFGEFSSYRADHVKGYYSNSFTYIDFKGVYIDGRE